MNRRYFLLGTGTAIASFLFASCTSSQNQSTSTLTSQNVSASQQTSKIKVGVWSVIAEDILKFVQKELASSQGLEIEIVTLSDWVSVNTALKSGEIDANYFQHKLFMEDSAKRLNLDLVMLNQSYITLYGFYSKRLKQKSLKEIPTGATIAIPNDVSNRDRTLKLLQTNCLIKLKEKSGELLTVKDISENPKNLKIQELESPALVRALDDIDLAVMSSSIPIQAKLDLQPIAREQTNDKRLAVELVTLRGKENDPNIQKLNQLLINPKVKDFINTKYKGSLFPVF
ncbi:NLPA lipoprotein [Nostoc sp. FACHB-145]|nr:NLPA lipoprotein [Nostoc sp. FACHB-145]